MTTQENLIYNVIRNSGSIQLSDLKEYFNVSMRQGATREDSRELVNDLNTLIESGYIIKANNEDGLFFAISDEALSNDLND